MRLIALVVLIGMARSMGAQTSMSQVKDMVTFLFRETESKTNTAYRPIGTAFWVGVRTSDIDPNRRLVVLVTAKHVICTNGILDANRLYYRANNGTNEPQMMRIPQNTKILVHKDRTVDLVAVFIPPPADQSVWRFCPLEMALTKSELRAHGIEEGDDVFFAGLFTSFFGTSKNVPIFRFGKLAMLSEERIPWETEPGKIEPADFYLMEAQSYGGNSGSPVFFDLSPLRGGTLVVGRQQIFLTGIMTGYFRETVARPLVSTTIGSLDSWNLGIAAVTPAHYLRELLDPLGEQRRAAESASKKLDKKPEH